MMTRRTALTAIPLLAASCARGTSRGTPPRFAAFSLREAERRVRAGASIGESASIGSLRRLLGAVHDRSNHDVVVVGVLGAGREPLSLDDFVAAMRAILRHREFPLVSIDKAPDTPTTGKLRIRFEGVTKCSYAARMLAADVILKKAALAKFAPGDVPFRSYFEMCGDAVERAAWTGAVSSRLWFHATTASLLLRDDVVAIRQLRLGVKAQVTSGAPDMRDEIGDRYAAMFSEHFDEIATRFPDVRRLHGLFEMAAVCKGIEKFDRSDLRYWLDDYPVPQVDIPSEFNLLRSTKRVESARDEQVLEIEGGVDTRLRNLRLTAGDHLAFRDAVVQSRPAAGALVWAVPLEAWRFSGMSDRPVREDSASTAGAHVEGRVLESTKAASDPRGGVDAGLAIRANDFRRRP